MSFQFMSQSSNSVSVIRQASVSVITFFMISYSVDRMLQIRRALRKGGFVVSGLWGSSDMELL